MSKDTHIMLADSNLCLSDSNGKCRLSTVPIHHPSMVNGLVELTKAEAMELARKLTDFFHSDILKYTMGGKYKAYATIRAYKAQNPNASNSEIAEAVQRLSGVRCFASTVAAALTQGATGDLPD